MLHGPVVPPSEPHSLWCSVRPSFQYPRCLAQRSTGIRGYGPAHAFSSIALAQDPKPEPQSTRHSPGHPSSQERKYQPPSMALLPVFLAKAINSCFEYRVYSHVCPFNFSQFMITGSPLEALRVAALPPGPSPQPAAGVTSRK